MSETENLIPRQKSQFLKVKCRNCGNEQFAFDRSSIVIKCEVSEETLVEPTGGLANIKGEVIQVLG